MQATRALAELEQSVRLAGERTRDLVDPKLVAAADRTAGRAAGNGRRAAANRAPASVVPARSSLLGERRLLRCLLRVGEIAVLGAVLNLAERGHGMASL
jgi:hypothetical protein